MLVYQRAHGSLCFPKVGEPWPLSDLRAFDAPTDAWERQGVEEGCCEFVPHPKLGTKAVAARASIPGRCDIILHLVASAIIRGRLQIRYNLGSHSKTTVGILQSF